MASNDDLGLLEQSYEMTDGKDTEDDARDA
jgi:hypothetical protein